MEVDSVDSSVNDHRFVIDIKRDPVGLRDLVFDVKDAPARGGLCGLMDGERRESTFGLFELDLQGRGQADTESFSSGRFEMVAKPGGDRVRIGGACNGRIEQPLQANMEKITESATIQLESFMFKRPSFFDSIEIEAIGALVVLFEVGDSHVPYNRIGAWDRNWNGGLQLLRDPCARDPLTQACFLWIQQQFHASCQ